MSVLKFIIQSKYATLAGEIKDDISIEWYGSSKPIKNLPENKKELNRRTEIILAPKVDKLLDLVNGH